MFFIKNKAMQKSTIMYFKKLSQTQKLSLLTLFEYISMHIIS